MSRSVLARMGAIAAGMLALGIAVPAWAASTVVLGPAGINQTAAGFAAKNCTIAYPDHSATEDGWHFVLPRSSGSSFGSVTLTFDGGVVGPVTNVDVNNPDTGSGWAAYIDDTGSTGKFKHVYVTTTAGWTLLAGTSKVDPDGHDGDTFNLAHTCPAETSQGTAPNGSPYASPNGGPYRAPGVTESGSPQPWPSNSESAAGGNSSHGSSTDSTGGNGDGGADNYRWPNGAPETGGGGSMSSRGFVLGTGAVLISGLAGLGLALAARRRRNLA